jgi:hypothetical protein
MSSSYILYLTAEASPEDLQVFLNKGLGAKNNFTPASLEKLFKTKIDLSWSGVDNAEVLVANHLFKSSYVKGSRSRALLINGGLLDSSKFENLVFYIWRLSLSFPRLTFRLYGDDYQNSAFLNVYESGLWMAYSLISGEEYYKYVISSDQEFEIDGDAIKNALDKKFNDGLAVDSIALKIVELIRKAKFGMEVKSATVIEIFDINQKQVTDELRLATIALIACQAIEGLTGHMKSNESGSIMEFYNDEKIPLSQPIVEFSARLKLELQPIS